MSVTATPAPGSPASGARDSTSGPRPRGARRASSRPFVPRIVLVGLVPAVAVALAGLPYYLLPLAGRLRHPWHDWLRPSGLVGQSAGFLAFGLFLFLWLYPIRKKMRALAFTGSLGRWLEVHIAAGILVPLIGAIHAGWRFDGLIGMGYLSMLVVSLSGVVGRYLYVHIPRSRDGLELSRAAVADERRALLGALVEQTGIPAARLRELLRPVPVPDVDTGLALPRLPHDRATISTGAGRSAASSRSGSGRAPAPRPTGRRCA